MKRVKRSPFSKRVFRRRLYLDDLENIISMVEEHGCSVKLADKQYEYKDLTELVNENPNGLRYLELTAEVPDKPISTRYVTITCNLQIVSIDESFITSPNTLALATSLAASLNRGFSWLPYSTFVIATLLFIYFCLLLLLSISSISTGEIVIKPTFWGIFSLLGVVSALTFTDIFFGKTIITRHHRKDQSYIERNWDKILLAVISGFITLVLSKLIPWVIETLSN